MYDRLTQLLKPVAGLFDVASVEAMALRLLGAVLVLLAAFWISTTAQRYLVRRLHGHDEGQEETRVGVSYDSDLRKVRATLEGVCEGLDWKSAQKQPLVQLFDLGDSSVVFRVMVWIEDPWVSGRRRSELNEAIWWALKDAGIVIAFPQLDVHIARNG